MKHKQKDLFCLLIRLPKVDRARLEALAKEKDRSLNWLVSQFVIEKLEEYDEQMKA